MLAHQRDDHRSAVDYIGRAIALHDRSAVFHCNLGAALQALGKLEDAALRFHQAIRIDRNFAEAHYNLGMTFRDGDQLDESIAAFREVIRIDPEYVEAHNNLGGVFASQRDFAEAAACYRRAIEIQPKFTAAHFNLGNALHAQGRLEEAVRCFRDALDLAPQTKEFHNNLGRTLRDLGEYDEAITSFGNTLLIDPNDADALDNLTGVLQITRRSEATVENLRTAIRIQPESADTHYNLGVTLQRQSRAAEAVAAYERALQLRPGFAEAHSNLAVIHQSEGRMELAAEHYRQALSADPTDLRRVKPAIMLPPIHESQEAVATWRLRLLDNVNRLLAENVRVDPSLQTVPTNFYVAYQGYDARELLEKINRLYQSSHVPDFESSGKNHVRDGRIRVGFISKCFHNHTIGRLMRGLIAELSRDEFHVTVLTPITRHDEIGEFIRRQADCYVELSEDLPVARRRIAQQRLDILFYTDIGMDPVTSTLAHSRLAPVQCATWGHPVTTGMQTIDYFLSSELIEPPDGENHYTETLVRLSTLPTYYYRPQLPATLKSRRDFGLPDEAHLYLCPQSLIKIHPDFDEILAKILRKDSRGLIVFIDGLFPNWTRLLRNRFQRSIYDAVDRLRFLPKQEHADFLNLMAVSDVMLDPLHFGGGNTCYEACALGMPIVTLPSRFMRGRGAYALYRKMGLMECVAESSAEYVDVALRLANDAAYRSVVHHRIVSAAGCLYEDDEAVREIERFLRQVVR